MAVHHIPIIISVLIIASLPFTIAVEAKGNSSEPSDADRIEFALNLEYLEAEFFLYGALGYGLDVVAPELAGGGPAPIGAQLAALSPLVRDLISQFAYQEVGHLRAIKKEVKGFPRPVLDLRLGTFARIMDSAFGRRLYPPFDPYASEINYLLASYVIPYVGLTGYVGTNPQLQNTTSKRLVAGLLGVESGQDAVIRTWLYERLEVRVMPYRLTVAEFTNRISVLRDRLGNAGVKDEGLVVPMALGAEGRVVGNVLAGNNASLSYDRTPEEILRIVYGTGDAHIPGGFFPNGASGAIAKSFLQS
ncbi:ferritin-like catalase Nec2 [Arachis stenosperma]|uniref:ferritin-like catalase Nec2 n=1 Tax=Arachis stenosperma TaxID=217475 RepID=UPI0025ABA0CC|nr:ferritin-like catalase Nec2 [Arachis stenosperma]